MSILQIAAVGIAAVYAYAWYKIDHMKKGYLGDIPSLYDMQQAVGSGEYSESSRYEGWPDDNELYSAGFYGGMDANDAWANPNPKDTDYVPPNWIDPKTDKFKRGFDKTAREHHILNKNLPSWWYQ